MITYGCHLSIYQSQVLDFVWDFCINVSKHKRSICTLKHKHKYKLQILQIQPLLWVVAIETCTKLLVSKSTHCVKWLGKSSRFVFSVLFGLSVLFNHISCNETQQEESRIWHIH
jgi:hypothetical protein